jgi:hypothetical protein
MSAYMVPLNVLERFWTALDPGGNAVQPTLITLRGEHAGDGTLTGPGSCDVDMALHRILWKHENHSVRVRAEVFNAANHPNFLNPDGLALFDRTLHEGCSHPPV